MIFHLTVIVVLLIHQLDISKEKEAVYIFDFTKQEEIEKEEKELEKLMKEMEEKEDMIKKLEQEIEQKLANATSNSSAVKNLAVNTGGQLKDDRGTDADQLYKDAKRLEEQLKNGQNKEISDIASKTSEEPSVNNTPKKGPEYSGPSVLSYTLDGRTATSLPIPAYRCFDGGQVTVIIQVGRQGNVLNAKVNETVSSTNKCLQDYALRAALQSRFSKSDTAPERQTGEIVYQFIAQ